MAANTGPPDPPTVHLCAFRLPYDQNWPIVVGLDPVWSSRRGIGGAEGKAWIVRRVISSRADLVLMYFDYAGTGRCCESVLLARVTQGGGVGLGRCGLGS